MAGVERKPLRISIASGEKKRSFRTKIVFIILTTGVIGAALLYFYSRTYAKIFRLGIPLNMIPDGSIESVMGRAVPHLIAMLAASAVLAVISLSFQTIVQSRVLTPSMIGFDSVFVGTQTLIVFFLGAYSAWFTNPFVNYFLTAGIMVVVSMFMFGFILRSNRNNIVFLLMFGLVLSGIIGSGTRYLQVIMAEGDFVAVMAATSVNINNINVDIVYIALPLILAVIAVTVRRHRRFNVMSLGAEQAKSLGIHYERELRFNLIVIAIGMSVATALIGSLTFLGLLAVNAAREVLKTNKHLPLFIGSAMMSMLTLVLGQAVMELIEGAIPVTAIINLVGCSYVFYLILKENKA